VLRPPSPFAIILAGADIVQRLELITTGGGGGASGDEERSYRRVGSYVGPAEDRVSVGLCTGPASLQINDIDGRPGDETGDRGGRVHVLIDPVGALRAHFGRVQTKNPKRQNPLVRLNPVQSSVPSI